MTNKELDREPRKYDYKEGSLPKCAPLAISFVPVQEELNPQYAAVDALAHGTLFPGLNLPWKNVTSKSGMANTPLGELMALGFVINELNLYLDTHKNDTEALEVFVKYTELYNEGQRKYAEIYGPVTLSNVTNESFSWINDPWPWDNMEGAGG